MFENPGKGRQARNFTTNVLKILDLKSTSEHIFSENWRWVPLKCAFVIDFLRCAQPIYFNLREPIHDPVSVTERELLFRINFWVFE